MLTNERARVRDTFIEPGRGVYDAHRAAALAGVPERTLHYWAQTQTYLPSISLGPRSRLWSWTDLLALRAIDWFRKGRGDANPVSMGKIRQALEELVNMGHRPGDLYRVAAVSRRGTLFFEMNDRRVQAAPGQQEAFQDVIYLVRPYDAAPDLLQPGPLLRIIPGKLHGEPHILDTRIPSAAVSELFDAGYSMGQIHEMYPDASFEALEEAVAFERSLVHAA